MTRRRLALPARRISTNVHAPSSLPVRAVTATPFARCLRTAVLTLVMIYLIVACAFS
jgi:hypothetical protein